MISREAWKIDLDELEVVLGVWMFFSPWVFAPAAAMSGIAVLSILGLVIAADGMWALGKPAMRSPEWLMVLLGLGVVCSPWLLGLTGETALTWNVWIVGVALVVLAGLASFTKVEGESDTTRMAH
jgi:hypothetical protein